MTQVRVRMYRQGLGDCFLLTFPGRGGAGSRDVHMLIDCGVLKGTPSAVERMNQVAESIKETTGGQLDVLIATHEHWDHLSGFLQAETVFNEVKVAEVWLAWTEDPDSELGKRLRRRRRRAQRALRAVRQRLKALNSRPALRSLARIDSLLGFFGDLGAAKGRTTARALRWVAARDGAKIRYCHPGERPLKLSRVDGVRIFVLGPPEDETLLKRSRPRKGANEAYSLALSGAFDPGFFAALPIETNQQAPSVGERDAAERNQPFDRFYRVEEVDARNSAFFREHYGSEDSQSWRQIEHDWLEVASRLALHLDSDTNNTSLALAIELVDSGRVLLFPADAQVGNWLSWANLSWRLRDPSGEVTRVRAADLLRRTVLYKVGHHGSHNATLREQGLELMQNAELVAMIPVSAETAKIMEWKMPFRPLLSRLREKTHGRVIRADTGITNVKPAGITAREWSAFTNRVALTEDYIDYLVDM